MLRHRGYDSLIAFLDDHPTSCRFVSTSNEFAPSTPARSTSCQGRRRASQPARRLGKVSAQALDDAEVVPDAVDRAVDGFAKLPRTGLAARGVWLDAKRPPVHTGFFPLAGEIPAPSTSGPNVYHLHRRLRPGRAWDSGGGDRRPAGPATSVARERRAVSSQGRSGARPHLDGPAGYDTRLSQWLLRAADWPAGRRVA